jgi:hypothetical protein
MVQKSETTKLDTSVERLDDDSANPSKVAADTMLPIKTN